MSRERERLEGYLDEVDQDGVHVRERGSSLHEEAKLLLKVTAKTDL